MPEKNLPKDETPPLEVIASKELKVLYSWLAPARSFKRRDKEFWTTVIAIVVLVGLILFFVQEFFLIAAIISLTFVYYVLSTVEPEEKEYKITNRGLVYDGVTYLWETIQQFWFSDKYGQRMVNFELFGGGISGRLSILVGKGDEKKIREILLKFLVEEEIKPNFLDNAASWLQKKIPLEGEKSKDTASITIPLK